MICEPFRHWVLEDNFPQGRPALEAVGAEFVADVSRHKAMKLRILNGGHAAIAYAGALLGYHFVHDAMADGDIAAWLRALETREIIPTLQPIEGVDYAAYLDLIVARFSNPEIGDTTARLCLDGSNRQPKFILPTLRDRLAAGAPIDGLALVLALWCRSCEGTTEGGAPIAANDGNPASLRDRPAAVLDQRAIFGDLGQQPDLVGCFARALQALHRDGVRATLAAYAG